ncbi:MAG: hypothetical protein E7Z87_03450 [Cyanobacteria bacterium SIG26]|nr:hypothetical protein [Cyanobacteria bacterium SIG26]
MNKNGWIICLIIFVFVTTFVLSLDDSSTIKRVKFSNSDVNLGHESAEFVKNPAKMDIKVSKTDINNSKIDATNSNLSVDYTDNFINSSVTFSDSKINSEDNSIVFDGQQSGIVHKNLDDSHLDIALDQAKKIAEESKNPRKREPRYLYKNIDWSTWKSNFVNRILDDSLSIRELDKYNDGDWFQYSFEVDNTGKISNIKVFSMSLSQKDKDRVVQLIRNYQYDDITLFPQNTNRKYAKVSAIMLLSNTTKKSNPSDFSDVERIKIKLDY